MNERRKPYPFDRLEPKWQATWEANRSFHAANPGEEGFDPAKPKYYVLDMFPYPSGAGLHVGHPEGYTATDIIARYKRLCGFNVLHPMGWDAFGLPAEQYAIKTGQHPAITTRENVAKFKTQLKRIGFSYDWEREINTTDPGYYRWTQWIFLQIYNSWFNPETKEAEPISTLLEQMRDWLGYQQWSPVVRRKLIDDRRLAYVEKVDVWWCPGLGTVLANEEVIDGKSEVGGYPVERRPMQQWMLRITKYAERLVDDLQQLDWPDSIKALQRNWVGRSEGAMIEFTVERVDSRRGGIVEFGINVFTTRPDTIYGVTYLVLAPEHPFVDPLTSEECREEVQAYRQEAAAKSTLLRTDLSKEKTGVFTGCYATNPINGQRIPVWIGDYVVVKYGAELDIATEVVNPNVSRRGAVMGVPAHDERDFEFARTYQLPVLPVVAEYVGERHSNIHAALAAADVARYAPPPVGDRAFVHQGVFTGEGVAINSPVLDGLPTKAAKEKIITWLEQSGNGRRHVNYKLNDWLFSRQRYWGEPFPIIWHDGKHQALAESELPLEPPALEDFKPTGTGEPPLAKAKDWIRYSESASRETNTMPQWAGSCWYYLRFCDPQNEDHFVGKPAERYWSFGPEVLDLSADLTGQEFYDCAKLLFVNEEEKLKPGAVDLYIGGVEHAVLHLLYARFWHKVLFDLGHVSKPEPFQRLINQGMILGEDGRKMSKRWGNVIDPIDVIEIYGADAFRCYEMFMGPLEQMKPWSMKGVEGVSRFLARVWRLVMEENQAGEWVLSDQGLEVEPMKSELKVLHATIKKVTGDIETLSFNTAISQMMILVNALTNAPAVPISALRTLLILLNPFAPHLTSDLWEKIGGGGDITEQPWPKHEERWLIEDEVEMVVQVNGKVRDRMNVAIGASEEEVKKTVFANFRVQQFIANKDVKKFVFVPNKLVNIVTR